MVILLVGQWNRKYTLVMCRCVAMYVLLQIESRVSCILVKSSITSYPQQLIDTSQFIKCTDRGIQTG